ncbi:transcriptional regulatory protein AlgP-like [Bactrocera neohumeralis]|uniref:transcriptional regulatory protein AlgP-like n=1 Tax=Bactrocera neohumeralis TaxID=98809 RepID=UPI002165587A|nr:transcriptional regulatory protein AlgP-like [Bactrocera neohumeralis]
MSPLPTTGKTAPGGFASGTPAAAQAFGVPSPKSTAAPSFGEKDAPKVLDKSPSPNPVPPPSSGFAFPTAKPKETAPEAKVEQPQIASAAPASVRPAFASSPFAKQPALVTGAVLSEAAPAAKTGNEAAQLESASTELATVPAVAPLQQDTASVKPAEAPSTKPASPPGSAAFYSRRGGRFRTETVFRVAVWTCPTVRVWFHHWRVWKGSCSAFCGFW